MPNVTHERSQGHSTSPKERRLLKAPVSTVGVWGALSDLLSMIAWARCSWFFLILLSPRLPSMLSRHTGQVTTQTDLPSQIGLGNLALHNRHDDILGALGNSCFTRLILVFCVSCISRNIGSPPRWAPVEMFGFIRSPPG